MGGTDHGRDGTAASIVPTAIIGVLLFIPTLYISLDTSQSWTGAFDTGPQVKSISLFILTMIWPAVYVTSRIHGLKILPIAIDLPVSHTVLCNRAGLSILIVWC